MIKILRHGQHLEMAVMVGIDPQCDSLARARRAWALRSAHEGVGGLMQMAEFADIDFVFDATPGRTSKTMPRCAKRTGSPRYRPDTAAIRPSVPVVNLTAQTPSGQRQYGDLRRAGDHPNPSRGLASGDSIRGDRRLDRHPRAHHM
ncbi:hypothetical protein ACB309_15865 [Klebsiella pneumoniae]